MAVPILKEPPITSRDAFIPYLMTALNMVAPVIAAHSILYAHVFVVAIILILLGIPCSVYFRQRGYHRIVLNLLTTVPLLILTWALVRTHPGLQLDWSHPLESMLSRDSLEQLDAMLHVFTVLAAGRAFLLVTSADLLQTPLPGISIFLLAVITHKELNTNPVMLCCLLILFATSAYLFTHEQHQQWFAIHTPPRIQRQLVVWTLILSLLLFPLIFVAGSHLERFNLFAVASRTHRPGRLSGFRLRLGGQPVVSFSNTVDMGGLNWPTGRQPIMTVEVPRSAPQNLLWRGQSFATYRRGQWVSAVEFAGSGSVLRGNEQLLPEKTGWQQDTEDGGREQLRLDPHGPAGDPGVSAGLKSKQLTLDDPGMLVRQKITLEAPMQGPAAPLYGAYPMASVIGSSRLINQPRVTRDGAVLVNRIFDNRDDTYAVISILKPMPSVLQLAQAPLLPDREIYLDMGMDPAFIAQIHAKALEMLGRIPPDKRRTTYDMVHQFELELGQQYRYTLKPAAPPRGEDPIVDFLYRQKKGYCNYFSGAMVMLCRSVGIPARFVVGFATGDQVEGRDNAETVIYNVHAGHAHSWVEVYLPDYGWYTVDPTAGSTVVPTVWGSAWDTITGIFDAVKNTVQAWTAAFRSSLRVRIITISAVLLIPLAGLVLFVVVRDRPPAMPRRPLTPAEAGLLVVASYRRMHRWLEHWGVQKPDGITASEFEALFRQLNPVMAAPVRALTDLYILREYGAHTLTDADARRAVSLLHELWTLSRTERRRLYEPRDNEV